jgi:NADPH-dependent 2,4-dienoyl-CoA reductase/sulfur reductase-like enzyme
MLKDRLIIIGGSDAGISAGLRAKELRPSISPTLIVADSFPNFSICGLPFFLSGEVADWRDLAHRSKDDLEKAGLTLLLDHSATSIDPGNQLVHVTDPGGNEKKLQYDRLLVATGAVSTRPRIEGIDLPGVHLLRWMKDSFAVQRNITERNPKNAVIVGGGYIGMEMADALTYRGISTTVVEFADTVLTTVDPCLGKIVASELERNNVRIMTGVTIQSIERDDGNLVVKGSPQFVEKTDLVLVAVGCIPNSELARSAGVETSMKGAIKVNRRMETNLPNVYAAGDCVETWHQLLGQYSYLPLGTTAHKQGRVAGENAAGGNREYFGSLGTQVVKIFDLVVARTGLRHDEAASSQFTPHTEDFVAWDHKMYYPGAKELRIRITGDKETGSLLGAQIIGHKDSEVSKRIDVYATALSNKMTVEAIEDLDLSYTPPLGSPWDAIQMAAQAWLRTYRA